MNITEHVECFGLQMMLGRRYGWMFYTNLIWYLRSLSPGVVFIYLSLEMKKRPKVASES
jgi:uncharacterized membrane protein